MIILAIDLGDRWVGTALSDPLQIAARPLKTVEVKQLDEFIKNIISEKSISTIIVGYPKTFSGTESQQTKKIVAHKKKLEDKFSSVPWVLWDEKLSSKYASKLKKIKTKDDKIHSHSIAAAFILQSYLDHLQFKKIL